MKINIKVKIEIKAPCNEGSFVVFAVVSYACVFPCLFLLPSAMKLFMHTHPHTPCPMKMTSQHNKIRQNTPKCPKFNYILKNAYGKYSNAPCMCQTGK